MDVCLFNPPSHGWPNPRPPSLVIHLVNLTVPQPLIADTTPFLTSSDSTRTLPSPCPQHARRPAQPRHPTPSRAPARPSPAPQPLATRPTRPSCCASNCVVSQAARPFCNRIILCGGVTKGKEGQARASHPHSDASSPRGEGGVPRVGGRVADDEDEGATLTPDLQKNPVDGFSAGLVDDDNILEWAIVIMG